MARPNAIVWFERLYLGSWLLSLIGLAVNWSMIRDTMAENPAAQRLGIDTMMNIFVAFIGLTALVTLLLWYFTARQHSVVAKWFVVALFALGLIGVPGLIAPFSNGEWVKGFLQVAVFVLHAGAVAMLFPRDARVWFNEIRDQPPVPPAPLA
jgi:hypothetical protein